MPFSPPIGIVFHLTDEIPVGDLCVLLRRVIVFLQGLQVSSPRLRLYHDWWQHDGLHFEKGPATFHDLFAMTETPRALFDATPDEDEVFVGAAPEETNWYLRFRAEWDTDEKSIVGRFALVLPVESVAAFRKEIAGPNMRFLDEASSESYYHKTIV